MTRYATIISTGRYIPEIEVSNDELRERFAHIPDFVDKMEEFFRDPHPLVGARGLVHVGHRLAGRSAGVGESGTQTRGRRPRHPRHRFARLHHTGDLRRVSSTNSGAVNAGTFDVGCACASFPTGAAIASGLIAANEALQTVLVVGVYNMHKLAADGDPMVFFLRRRRRSAAVLEPADESCFVSSAMRADGSYHGHWGIYAGATFEPATEEAVREGRTTVKMIERYPRRRSTTRAGPRLSARWRPTAALRYRTSTSRSSPRCEGPRSSS